MESPDTDIYGLAISPQLKIKLIKAGFKTFADFEDLQIVDLAKEASIGLEDAGEVLRQVKQVTEPSKGAESELVCQPKTATEILKVQRRYPRIVSFCQQLDDALGGGVAVGTMTEFCGVPGIGKTQLGMQLAVNVHVPQWIGGSDGHAIYIDTEGSYHAGRYEQMAAALVAHISTIAAQKQREDPTGAYPVPTVDQVLGGTHWYRVHDYVQQLALINVLPSFLRANPMVRLVVLDSVAFHFRHDFDDFAARSRLLAGMAQALTALAAEHNVAVVVMNQVTTKMEADGRTALAPALGESWAHASTNRVMLHWKRDEPNVRIAFVYKSPGLPQTSVPFAIAAEGVRGVTIATRKRGREHEADDV